MAQYKVLSDNFAGADRGDTVEETALEGLNIEALIDGGHLAMIGSAKAKSNDEAPKDK